MAMVDSSQTAKHRKAASEVKRNINEPVMSSVIAATLFTAIGTTPAMKPTATS